MWTRNAKHYVQQAGRGRSASRSNNKCQHISPLMWSDSPRKAMNQPRSDEETTRGSCCEWKTAGTGWSGELIMARLHRVANAHCRRESRHIKEGELMRRIAASTSTVATMLIRGLRAMMVWSAERVSDARRHAHRCVRRSRGVHGARRENEEKSAVGHEPESDQRTQHASSDRAAHHANKVGLGTRCVQPSRELCRSWNDLEILRTVFQPVKGADCEYRLTQQVILIYSLYGRGNPLPNRARDRAVSRSLRRDQTRDHRAAPQRGAGRLRADRYSGRCPVASFVPSPRSQGCWNRP